MRQNTIMKKIIALLLVLSALVVLGACSSQKNTITTVAELDGCELTTVYTFDSEDKLESVKQKAVYTDSSALTYDYSVIEVMIDNYFTDVEKTENSVSLTLTEKGMSETYPDATYASILEMAEEQELEIETSK